MYYSDLLANISSPHWRIAAAFIFKAALHANKLWVLSAAFTLEAAFQQAN